MSDKFDGYTVEIFLDEDGDWLARLEELPNISAFANSPEQAIAELEAAWKLTKESYMAHGEAIPIAPARRQYSGQFNVRVDKRVHRALAIEAARAGISLNALVSKKLSENLHT
ncbi:MULTISPECIES: toxin-antitoxin system HicB family antitoxin [Nitrosomonas]|uniref:type II toxin-antitoxin system HicB family antitoxin n=1 Tax=Nitrosomonas TaxID=914 RepID=UPI0019388BD7|nr:MULTISPECIES: toxin-antitoxin system HicB family antitoxin [Nitrosomonas]QOJ08911.1 MAG: toxin-antitoxin system HicB family antitoxin [Nitrosomonas sp. H1_AOB3]HRO55960.1 toxin-antitoxin system HicB family antitoxin [Nitrosomonas europaea]HUM74510.1 toxin-antitoxin system HicB family antitoxin [Nitrosomonas europaea]